MIERTETVIIAGAVDFIGSSLTAILAQSWNVAGLDIMAPKSVPSNTTFDQNTLITGPSSGLGEEIGPGLRPSAQQSASIIVLPRIRPLAS